MRKKPTHSCPFFLKRAKPHRIGVFEEGAIL